VLADSEVIADGAERIAGKRVLVGEDGPTVTHGDMEFGAGVIAATRSGAAEIVNPRDSLVGTLKTTFETYPHIDRVLPAMGYGERQIKDLEATINGCDCDLVVSATPVDLARLVTVDKEILRVRYSYRDHGTPTLGDVVKELLEP
jgi:predicted GTPase